MPGHSLYHLPIQLHFTILSLSTGMIELSSLHKNMETTIFAVEMYGNLPVVLTNWLQNWLCNIAPVPNVWRESLASNVDIKLLYAYT